MNERFQLEEIISNIKNGSLPTEDDVIKLCQIAKDFFLREPNIIELTAPVIIVGDIHGQFPDLLQIFALCGEIPSSNYLFLGDYVDRGMYGVETIIMLFALKMRYPYRITLLRGNHESLLVTQVYGFYDECLKKYGSTFVWSTLASVFETLPLAALINDRIFCVHGGLSPHLKSLDEIRSIDRYSEVPFNGPMCDLLWSDPHTGNGWVPSSRGAGYLFGENVTVGFNNSNGIEYICRAHQLVMEGYKWHFGRSLVTVWSAPNYCYRCGNLASTLQLDELTNRLFLTFEAATQEYRINDPRKQMLDYFL